LSVVGGRITTMAGLNKDLYVTSECYTQIAVSDPSSWATAACGNCGADQMIVVGATNGATINDGYLRPDVQWLRCVRCSHGVVVNGGQISPAVMPLDIPGGLAADDLASWVEVRSCLSVGAFTAAVMMCRKLLFHMAVTHGLPQKNTRDKAPSFAEALDHLQSEEVITKMMRPWADKVKDVGNSANHELPAIVKEQAMDVAQFTRELLYLAYTLPSMVPDASPEQATPATPHHGVSTNAG